MTRGDCELGGELYQRPCPRTECRYSLTGAPAPRRGRPSGIVRDESQSCALDVADEGHSTLIEIGRLMGVSRERIRQLEFVALRKAKIAATRIGLDLGDIVPKAEHPLAGRWDDEVDSRGRPRGRLREGNKRWAEKKQAAKP